MYLQRSEAAAAVVQCVNGYMLRNLPQYQVRFYREANEAYASGPLSGTGPFQGPGRGPEA